MRRTTIPSLLILTLAAAVAAAGPLDDGKQALAEGRVRDAVDRFAAAVKAAPKSVEANLWLAKAQWVAGDAAEARRLWQGVLTLDPKNAAAKDNLAALAGLEADFAAELDRAAGLIDRDLAAAALAALNAMATEGYVPADRVGELRYQTARALAATGKAQEAATLAAEAAERAPADVAAKAVLLAATIQFEKLNAPETALALLDKAAAAKLAGTDAGRGALLKGRALAALGKEAEALAALSLALNQLATTPEDRAAAQALQVDLHVKRAARELAAMGTDVNVSLDLSIAAGTAGVMADEARTAARRAAAFELMRNAINLYRERGAYALAAGKYEDAAEKLVDPLLKRRARLEAAFDKLVGARTAFENEAKVRAVTPTLAKLGGAALDELDQLLSEDATEIVAQTGAQIILDHAGWLVERVGVGPGWRDVAVEVYERFAQKHPKAERAPEALLAAANQLHELAMAEASALPKIGKLDAADAKAMAQAWALLKDYATTRQAGEAIALVTRIADSHASRGVRPVAIDAYRQLLAHVPDAADAAAVRFNLAGLLLADALEASRKLIETGQKATALAPSDDLKAALAELAGVLADADAQRAALRTKAIEEVRKVAEHFRSLEAWDAAAAVLADAAKAAAVETDRDALALAEIDLRLAEGDAAVAGLEAAGRNIPGDAPLPAFAKAISLALALADRLKEADTLRGEALGRLDRVSNVYSQRRLWTVALAVYADAIDATNKQRASAALALRRARLAWARATGELGLLLTVERRPADLPLTEYAQAALAAASSVIGAHPDTPEAVAAVGLVREISRHYQGQMANAVARKVLDDFAKAHEKSAFAEAMRLDAVGVSLAAARKAFAEAANLAADAPPFAAFAPVLAEYKAFISSSGDPALIESAFNQILSVPPLHANRGLFAAAVALHGQLLKDFPGYDRGDEIWFQIAVTHARSVIGDVEGKLSDGEVEWDDSGRVLGVEGETSAWETMIREDQGQSGGQPSSRPAGEDVSGFADLQLAQAERQWMQRAMDAKRPVTVAGTSLQPPPPTADEQTLKKQKAALDAARDAFLKVVTDFPASVLSSRSQRGVQVIVRWFADSRRWEAAAETLEAFAGAVPVHPAAEDVLFQAAEARTQAAAEQVAEAERAKLAAFAARFEAARAAWDAFAGDWPDSKKKTVARFRRATTHYQEGLASLTNQPDHAVHAILTGLDALEALRAADPNDPLLSRVPALVYDAAVLLGRMNRHELAADVYRRFVAAHPVDPRAPEAALKVAHLLNNFVGDRRGAILAYQAFLASYPSDQADKVIRLIFEIGKGFHDRQEWSGAMMAFDLFLANYPTHPLAAEAAVRRGDVFRANGGWTEAVAAYEAAIEQYPSDAVRGEVAFKIGQCYENLSAWEKAVARYNSYLENHPDDPQAADVRSRILVLGDLGRFQEVIDKYPGSTKRHDAQFQIARKVETDLKNPDKARVEYAKVVADFPTSQYADDSQFRIGEILFAEGDFAGARAAFEALVGAIPQSNLADDAWLQIGRSFEAEADREARITRSEKLEEMRQLQEHEKFEALY